MPTDETRGTTVNAERNTGGWRAILSLFFARKPVSAAVTTRMHFEVSPERAWNLIVFYEEVPGNPPFPLRTFMPHPIRTEGNKERTGSRVRCIYASGSLVKRITEIQAPWLIEFEVIEQHLGIEGCVRAQGGSYEIDRSGDGVDIALTTRYWAYLHPRFLWRPLEKLITTQLHRHVLDGMRRTLPSCLTDPASNTEYFKSESLPEGDASCTASQSPSRL